jgi:hypothetical protein
LWLVRCVAATWTVNTTSRAVIDKLSATVGRETAE